MSGVRDRRASALAAALLAAWLAAKAIAWGAVPGEPGRLLALPWDDVALAAAAGCIGALLPRALSAALLATLVAHAACAALLVRALGVPVLPSTLRGCDAAMLDSLAPYATLANGACAAAIAGAAVLGARCGRRWPATRRTLLGLGALAAALAVLLPAPERAAHRNPVVAFVRALLPRPLPDAPAPESAAPVARDPATRALAAVPGCARGRSVVLVVLESVAARFVAPRGGPAAMPFLAELAAAGASCSAAWAVYPESIEGQVALLCGLPPRPDAAPADYRDEARAALPHRLRALGHRSALFHAGRFDFLGMRDVIGGMGFDVLADAATIRGARESSFGVDEEAAIGALLRWVREQDASRPLLACWLPIAGHHPYSSPAGGPFPTDSELGCYRNAIHYADRSLRALWQGLCELRPPEHWLLCVVGDHGQAFGEHCGNRGHSFELFEENLHVPLLFVAAGAIAPGIVHEQPCTHLDVVPTLLDLLGAGGGPSLLRPGPGAGTVHAFTDWGELLVAARAGDWKLIHDVRARRDRLFDLATDPHERVDVAATHGERTAALRRSALAFLRRASGRE
jgi:lipoteichoic acid synthase